MKKLIIKTILSALFCALLLIMASKCNAQLKQDKVYHSIAGIGIATGTHFSQGLFYRDMNPMAPSLIAMTAATFKEGYDVMNGGQYSWSDWAFTTVSGMATNTILRLINKPKKRKDPFDFNPELVKK